MTLKPGQWVIIPPTLYYWPYPNLGPFKIKQICDTGGTGPQSKWYILENAPNSVYIKDAILYKPQVGDKVKILKPMNGFNEYPNVLKDQTGKIGIITHIEALGLENQIAIKCEDDSHGWWYVNEENVYYELVEPKGSINTAAPEPPSIPVVKPTKRVLNGNV